jgi:predicted acetyltransferase
MPRLHPPTAAVRDSYIAGELAVCAEEGMDTAIIEGAERDFENFVERRLGQRTLWDVPVTELWYLDGKDYIGTVIIRHRLTTELEVEGGHIGFHVVPACRREGHATRMLAEARSFARSLGLRTLLLTCDVTNAASRRVIERNDGHLLSDDGRTARYRVPT